MAVESAATSGRTITSALQKLLLSTIRLSGACTLYGVEQMEMVVASLQEGEGFPKQLEKLEATVNSLAECFVEEISSGKQETVKSISHSTEQAVRQSLGGMSLLDPRELLGVASNLMQKSSATVSNWMQKEPSVPSEVPRLAAEVLASSVE